jgi:hypothetical protein
MSVSQTKWERPARFRGWALNVDDRAHPSQLLVSRYLPADADRWHAGPYEEVLRLPFHNLDPDALVKLLTREASMPSGIAMKLTFQLSAKLAALPSHLTVVPIV